MKSINFDEGYREYKVNEDENRIIRVKLSDFNLLKRIENALTEIDKLKEKFKTAPDADGMAEFDKKIREITNKAFDTDVCTPAFGNANVCTPVESGKFLYMAFFEAFLPILRADLEAVAMTRKINQPEVRPEVKKYMKAPTISPKPVAGMANPYGAEMPDISGLTSEQKKLLLAQLIS